MALLNHTPRLSHKEPQWRESCDDLFAQFVDSDPYDNSDNTADSCSSGDLGSIWEFPEPYHDDCGSSDHSAPASSATSVTSKSFADLGQVVTDTTRSVFIGESVGSCKPHSLTRCPKMAQPLLSPRGSQERLASKLEERAERLTLREKYQQGPASGSQSANPNQWDDQSTFVSMSTTSPCQDVSKIYKRSTTYENNTNLRHSQSVPQYSTSNFSPVGSPMSEGPYAVDQRAAYHHLHTPATTTDTPFFQDYFFSDAAYTHLAQESHQQEDQEPAWEQVPPNSTVFNYSPYDATAPEEFQDAKVHPWWQASPAQPCSPAYQSHAHHQRTHLQQQQQQQQLSNRQSNDNLTAFARHQQLQQPLGGPPQQYVHRHTNPTHISDAGLMIQLPPSGTPLQLQQQRSGGSFTTPIAHPLPRIYSANPPTTATLTSPTHSSTVKSRHASNVEHLRQQRSRSDLRQKSLSSPSPSPDSPAKHAASSAGGGGSSSGGSMRRPVGKSGTHRRSKTAAASSSGTASGVGVGAASGGGSGGPGAGGASVGFVNYTPDDKRKILTGVAPSGSSKTKARREKEAADKRRRLSRAAQKAVLEAGGDLSALEREGFLLEDL